MVGSRHGAGAGGATRVFTDREQPVALFEGAFEAPQSWAEGDLSAYRTLVWYGVGGQGKTELRKEFCRRIETRIAAGERIALGVVDFETPEHRSLLGGLLKLRASLGRGRRVIFPTFDFAYAAWFMQARPGADIRTAHPELFRGGESEIVDDLADWAADAAGAAAEVGAALIPGAGLLYKYGHRLTGGLRKWWDTRSVKAKIAEMAGLSEPELIERLPVYLGYDLWRAAQAEAPPRLVVMLDTYEALWRDATRQSSLLTDQWVRDLVEAAPGTLFAIFGRDRLRWNEIDPDWKTILDQHPLGGLSEEDADHFLQTAGVPSEALRTRIIEGAEGLPFYLDLALDQFEDLTQRTGFLPKPEDFGGTPAEVLDRFLRHLSDDEERELRLASYPDALGEALFGELVEAFLGGVAAGDWPRLVRRSFMSPSDSGRHEMHALMRDALQTREASERGETYRRIHHWLFEHHDARAQPADLGSVTLENEEAFLAASRHLRVSAPETVVDWLRARFVVFRVAARWRVLEMVLAPIEPDVEGIDLSWVLNALGTVRKAMGRYPEAEALFSQALEIVSATFGDRHPEYASSLHALADAREAMGCDAEAAALYEQALEIKGATLGDRHPDYATTLHALAGVRTNMGRYPEAKSLYEQALEIKGATTLGDRHPDYAVILNNMARVLKVMGHNPEAEALYEQALEIYSATLGDRHPHYATTLHSLAWLRRIIGRLDEADSGSAHALAIMTSALGADHPRVARVLDRRAMILADLCRTDEARRDSDRAVAILETALGADHPWSIDARENRRSFGGATEWSDDG